MPSNLNALIRYKQIDRCLRNRFVNCTISRMQKKCSEQLAEHRGIYKLVSERSIREDIKTMRGDSLGFNAPIVVKNGTYSYSDENYSIFKTSIDDIELLKTVMLLLIDEKDNIANPKLKSVLTDLSIKTGIELPAEYVDDLFTHESIHITSDLISESIADRDELFISKESNLFDISDNATFMLDNERVDLYNWDDILNLF